MNEPQRHRGHRGKNTEKKRMCLFFSVFFPLCPLCLCGSFFLLATPAVAADAPLADAAEKADWPRVQALLNSKIDANASQADGMTALHWAAYHDDASTAERMIAAGAKPKAPNR